MEDLLNAEANSTVSPNFESKSTFSSYFENHFCVLDDVTVIGVDTAYSSLIIEDLSNNDPNYSPVKFGNHPQHIYSIIFSKKHNVLMVGEYAGRVVQYSLKSYQFGQIEQDYQNTGLSYISSSALMGDVAFFGEWNTSKISAINMRTRKMIGTPFQSACGYVYSLQICILNSKSNKTTNKVFLSSCGELVSNSKPDVFDITGLLKANGSFSEAEYNEKTQENQENSKASSCGCNSEFTRTLLIKTEEFMNNVLSKVAQFIESHHRAGRNKIIFKFQKNRK